MSQRFLIWLFDWNKHQRNHRLLKESPTPQSDSSNYTLLNISLSQSTVISNIINSKEFNPVKIKIKTFNCGNTPKTFRHNMNHCFDTTQWGTGGYSSPTCNLQNY